MKIPSVLAVCLLLAILFIAASVSLPASAQTRPVPNAQLASKELNARVEALLKKMTLDEKVGQLAQYTVDFATGPGSSNLKYEDLVAKGEVGSLQGVVGAEATNRFQRI